MAGTTTPANVADVEEALRDVIDPELGINVVDLGLVYGVQLDENQHAVIDMTLTSAACPLTDVLEDQTARVPRGPRGRLQDQLGVDAAVGPRQDHRRRSRAAQGARLQRLSASSARAAERAYARGADPRNQRGRQEPRADGAVAGRISTARGFGSGQHLHPVGKRACSPRLASTSAAVTAPSQAVLAEEFDVDTVVLTLSAETLRAPRCRRLPTASAPSRIRTTTTSHSSCPGSPATRRCQPSGSARALTRRGRARAPSTSGACPPSAQGASCPRS